jgi:hypothetical protein
MFSSAVCFKSRMKPRSASSAQATRSICLAMSSFSAVCLRFMISGLRSGEAREATSSSSEIIDGSDAPGNHGCIGGLGACAEGDSVNVIVIDERRSMEPPWAPADCADGVAAGSAAAACLGPPMRGVRPAPK